MADTKISQLTSASTPLAGTETLPIVQSGATVKATVANIVGAGTSPGSFTGLSATAKTGSLVNNSASLTEWRIGNTTVTTTGDGQGVGFYFNTTRLAGIRNAVKAGSLQTTISAWSGSVETDVWDMTATNATFSNVNLVQGTAAKGVNFTANTPAAGMTSQLLNWYEEGTWTPTVTANTGTITSYTASGKYTRIGRSVVLSFQINITDNGSGGGYLRITGMPFNAAAITSEAGSVMEYSSVGFAGIMTFIATSTLSIRKYDASYPGGTGYALAGQITYTV